MLEWVFSIVTDQLFLIKVVEYKNPSYCLLSSQFFEVYKIDVKRAVLCTNKYFWSMKYNHINTLPGVIQQGICILEYQNSL